MAEPVISPELKRARAEIKRISAQRDQLHQKLAIADKHIGEFLSESLTQRNRIELLESERDDQALEARQYRRALDKLEGQVTRYIVALENDPPASVAAALYHLGGVMSEIDQFLTSQATPNGMSPMVAGKPSS